MSRRNSNAAVWSRIDMGAADACWPWTGASDAAGYGVVSLAGGTRRAHRVAWELTHGPIPDGLCACHKCDNPPCCNPAHLFLGTRAENNRDRMQKGRNAKVRALPSGDAHWTHVTPECTAKGSAHGRSKLTEAQVLEMREKAAAGEQAPALAAHYGVTVPMVHLILTGMKWTHVGGPTRPRGERAKLGPAEVLAIRAAADAGEQYVSIATRFGVTSVNVRAIALRRTWKSVA